MSFPDEVQRWNSRFSTDEYLFGTAPNAFLTAQAGRLSPGMTALSVADGEGRNSVWLAERGLSVTAFDVSPVGVAKAQRLAAERSVQVDYSVASIHDYDWTARQYDVVIAIFIQFADPQERARIFAGVADALAPGGLLLLQGYTPRQLEYKTGGPPHVEHLYTEPLLREAFAGLEILHLAAHDSEIREGKGHSGMSALIDLVARQRPRPAAKP
jgi:cyclopropane fatty-acyl-phospholipid synthase-like methyltransferase